MAVDTQLRNSDRQREGSAERADRPGDSIGRERRHLVSEQHAPEPKSYVRDDEPNGERVMRNEPHVPRIREETRGSAGGP